MKLLETLGWRENADHQPLREQSRRTQIWVWAVLVIAVLAVVLIWQAV